MILWTPSRQAELGALNRVRRRDGHVCGSLGDQVKTVDEMTSFH